VRQSVSGDPRPRQAGVVALGAICTGDGASIIAVARPRRGSPSSRNRAFHRRFAHNRRVVEAGFVNPMATRRSTWLAVVVAVIVLVAVLVTVAVMWEEIGDVELSTTGWVALVLGVLFATGLGVGLMALLFYSEREGYDDPTEPER